MDTVYVVMKRERGCCGEDDDDLEIAGVFAAESSAEAEVKSLRAQRNYAWFEPQEVQP